MTRLFRHHHRADASNFCGFPGVSAVPSGLALVSPWFPTINRWAILKKSLRDLVFPAFLDASALAPAKAGTPASSPVAGRSLTKGIRSRVLADHPYGRRARV